jgi:hypothetical protein
MLWEDWHDELADQAFFAYGNEAYNDVSFNTLRYELMWQEGLSIEEALLHVRGAI